MGNRQLRGLYAVLVALMAVLIVANPVLAMPQGFRYTRTFCNGLNGYTAARDTTLDQWYPNQNLANQSLSVRTLGVKNALIYFDLSQEIPRCAKVRSATLRLFVTGRSNSWPFQIGAYAVRRSWVDTAATWFKATNCCEWATPGCNSLCKDRDPEPTGVADVPLTGQYVTLDITSIVQRWVRWPVCNKGVFIGGIGNISTEATFAPTDYASCLDQRPHLTVSWD